jgi:PAS domain S-box-containing protein
LSALRRDGSEFPVELSITKVETAEGAVFLGFIRDISDRRQVEEEVVANQLRTRLAVDASGLGIWDWDLITNAMEYSDLAKAIYGFAPGQAVTFEDVRNATHSEDLLFTIPMAEKALDPAIRSKEPYRYRVVWPNGETRWVVAHGEAIFEESSLGVRPVRYVGTIQDVTDERARDAALRESEERLRLALDAGHMAVWAVDVVNNAVTTSPELNRMLGFTEGHQPTIEELSERYRAGEQERVRAAGQAAIEANQPFFEVEYQATRIDGSPLWILLRAEIRFDARKEPEEVVGVLLDITARKAAEEYLKRSEARFRAAVRAVQGFVWTNNAAGEMVGEQPGWSALTGQAEQEYHGHGWSSAVHPDDAAATLTAWNAAVVAKGPFEYEHRVRRHDGEWRLCSIRAIPTFDGSGEIVEWVGVHTDVTEERDYQEKLRGFNASLEERVEQRTFERDRAWKNSQDLQAVLDEAGIIQAANEAWTTTLGWPLDEVVGKSHLSFNHPDQVEASAHAFQAASASALAGYETRCPHKDGSFRWISWVASPDGGRIYASGRNVTAEKMAAAELAAAHEALRQSQKMEAIGQLTGGVAHDFNNLLTIIRSSAELLRRQNLEENRRRRYVDAITDTADRAAKLTGQLLAFARRQALDPIVFNVADRVENIREMLSTVLGSRISLDLRLSERNCVVEVDANQFDTALINLAANARDAMNGEGLFTLQVALVPGAEGQPTSLAAISATDTGHGIANEDIDRVFEPFFTTKEVGRGTGLGLSQVFGFATQSGGAVTVSSDPGRGATFTLHLPTTAKVLTPRKLAAEQGSVLSRKGRILVVEDNVEVGEFSTELLADLGYQTQLATSAAEALAILSASAERFDAVFSDVVMPGMDGVSLAREIRRRWPALRVVLTSGYSHLLAADGPQGFELLRKPYSMGDLSKALEAGQ